MKNLKYIIALLTLTIVFVSCESEEINVSDEANLTSSNPFLGGTWIQEDQMARPAINTVLVSSGSKDAFNTTIPSEMEMDFQTMFQTNLEALSPAYDTPTDENALGLNSEDFSTLLVKDVLRVGLDGPTTFYDGTNVLTGRTLADDVITVELILIFGGETGLTANPENPTLVDDHVDANDKDFLQSFPYLAAPW